MSRFHDVSGAMKLVPKDKATQLKAALNYSNSPFSELLSWHSPSDETFVKIVADKDDSFILTAKGHFDGLTFDIQDLIESIIGIGFSAYGSFVIATGDGVEMLEVLEGHGDHVVMLSPQPIDNNSVLSVLNNELNIGNKISISGFIDFYSELLEESLSDKEIGELFESVLPVVVSLGVVYVDVEAFTIEKIASLLKLCEPA